MSVENAGQEIVITDLAAGKIGEIIKQQDFPEAFLRIFVAGIGCSGVTYGLGLETDTKEGDHIMDFGKSFKIVIDSNSFEYTDGVVVDWLESSDKSGFIIQNANAQSPCSSCASASPDCNQ